MPVFQRKQPRDRCAFYTACQAYRRKDMTSNSPKALCHHLTGGSTILNGTINYSNDSQRYVIMKTKSTTLWRLQTSMGGCKNKARTPEILLKKDTRVEYG